MSDDSLRHVAVIMDGNNRWAKLNGKMGVQGHRAGVEKIREVLQSCKEHGVEVLTLFAFSSENWQRPPKEVEALMGLFLSYLKNEAKKLKDERVRLRVIGNRSRFSEKIQKAIFDAEAIACEGEHTLVIAADYGGRWDMTQAARKLAEKVSEGRMAVDEIDEAALDAGMSTSGLPALDLMIRTGGDHRISNYLLWQAAYSELYFTDVLWPDFGADDLSGAIADFHSRQRRFGKTSEQVEQGQ
ncbi:polyprenyl diphosphate synthase [Candidatus Pelagadaptatus aseana]|uniref:polyprenyl diphosphate synthase n=1 Tax=Candidatus Pelagadaptatus aseana TaxID=3120508 RepID=UPI003C6EE775